MTDKIPKDSRKGDADHNDHASSIDFGKNPSLLALARHLARIAAENDYKYFQDSLKMAYNGDQPERGSP